MKNILSAIVLACTLIFIPTISHAAPLDEMKDLIRDEYYGDLPTNWEQATTIEELVSMLDIYSAYMTKEQYQKFYNSIDATSVGIGIIIEAHERGILVVQTIDGAGAQLAGIEPGDIITHVNNISISDKTIEESSSLIQGATGTKVNITYMKPNGQVFKKDITRQAFSVPITHSKLLANRVGYIGLDSFSQNAATLVKNEYTKLLNLGAQSIILDLQNNTGGYVNAAENMVGLFYNAPYAYTLKTATTSRKILSTQQAIKLPSDTRVLINGYSASASEMVAAALKDQQVATLYGQKSYGKGVMQAAYTLSDGSYFKLTIAEFLGPNRSTIQLVGVQPDIVTSHALQQAHFDAMVAQFDHYKALPSLSNVATTKTFTITFNQAIASALKETDVELITLGSDQKIPVKLTTAGDKITVTPSQALTSKQHYMLVIHPSIQSSQQKTLRNGYYLYITVK